MATKSNSTIPRKKRVKRVRLTREQMTPEQRKSADKSLSSRLRLIFNTTPEEKQKVLDYQGGVCAVTQKPTDSLYLDHSHKTGLLRGLLSYKINKGLGYFNDDPVLLRRTADYLENPTYEQAVGERIYGVMGRVTNQVKVSKGKRKGKNNRWYGPDRTEKPQPRAVFAKSKKEKQVS